LEGKQPVATDLTEAAGGADAREARIVDRLVPFGQPTARCGERGWFIEEGTLRPNRDDAARIQVPVTPPERYTLRLKVKRLFGSDQFAVGLIVGGRQTMASLDAYGGTVSGLHLVDGKTVKNNPTTHKGAVLPEDKLVNVKVRGASDAVSVEADGKKFVDWNGDAQRLSQDDRFAMPRTDWLYLATWNTQFAVSAFCLDDEAEKGTSKK
jgi:hypothetical protein